MQLESSEEKALLHFERCLATRRALHSPDRLIAAVLEHITLANARLQRADTARAALREHGALVRRSQTSCAGCRRSARPDGAQLDQCAGCLRTYYCSVACQTADWKREGGHRNRNVCKALQREAKAAGGGDASA